eukprot:g7929.t1
MNLGGKNKSSNGSIRQFRSGLLSFQVLCPLASSHKELYRNAYNLVLHKYGELLYNGVQGVVADHLKIVAQSCIECPDDRLLEELLAWPVLFIARLVIWQSKPYAQGAHPQDEVYRLRYFQVMIRDILMYMDRNFVTQYKKVPVYEMGLMIFREKVSGHPRVKTHLLTLMLDNISAERRGEQVDRILLKHTVNMLVELGVQGKNVYRECFEDHFLDHTRKFYQDESKQYISQNPCSDYLKKAEKRIREEKARVENYLHESTMEKIQELCDEEWIQVHYKTLIHMENSGCAWMFQCDKIADLERQDGRDVLNDPEKVKDPVSFITAILSLKYKYDRFDTRTAQYLSLYVDDQFRKGLKGMSSDADVDTALEQVVTVFRFLQDKDGWRSCVHMISKLKSECGHQYTSKLEGMFQDMKLSEDIMKQYKNSFASPSLSRGSRAGPGVGSAVSSASSSIDMKVSVLTSGFWPGSPMNPCTLPPESQECISRFETFYLAKHTGRKLTWQPQYGAADLKAQMPKTKHELSVSTYQMCILMLFNQQPTWTYQAIGPL